MGNDTHKIFVSSRRGAFHLTLQKIIEKYVWGGCVLEVGCSFGLISLELKARRPRIQSFLLDIDLHLLCSAKNNFKKYKLEFEAVLADAHRLPFKENSFDWIFSEGVIEHLDHLRQVIGELCRTSRKGVISFWSDGSDVIYRLKKWMKRLLRMWPYDRYGFERNLRPNEVEKLFEYAQMSIHLIRIEYHNVACIASKILKIDSS